MTDQSTSPNQPFYRIGAVSRLTGITPFAFEAYSAQCESRSPSDQALHAHLYCVAAHARALLEGALKQVAQAEGLEALLENNSAPERRLRTQAGQPPSALPSQT
jgi:hypothetical protein